ncbi:hypothetical protein [Thiomicrospira sp.]|uniref:hypothetical protein n=1 Tax=Thiomicrospira sp. TaxID=935 RepID=UPI002F926463
MFKYLTLIGVVIFLGWLLQRQWRLKKMQWKGERVPEQKGLRPITLLSLVMVVLYGGYMLWYLINQMLQTVT